MDHTLTHTYIAHCRAPPRYIHTLINICQSVTTSKQALSHAGHQSRRPSQRHPAGATSPFTSWPRNAANVDVHSLLSSTGRRIDVSQTSSRPDCSHAGTVVEGSRGGPVKKARAGGQRGRPVNVNQARPHLPRCCFYPEAAAVRPRPQPGCGARPSNHRGVRGRDVRTTVTTSCSGHLLDGCLLKVFRRASAVHGNGLD